MSVQEIASQASELNIQDSGGSSPVKFLKDIKGTDIHAGSTGIPKNEFIVLENGKASIEVQGELIYCLMTKRYQKAKDLCQLVLRVEPDHEVCKEMYGVICERLQQLEEIEKDGRSESDDSEDTEDEESDDEGSDDTSDSESSSSETSSEEFITSTSNSNN